MCFLCSATQTFDPGRHGEGDDDFAVITETSDAVAGTSTSYSMSAGDTFQGSIGSVGDSDWVAITLTAGETYTIALNAAGSGAGTLSDSYLRLMNGSGTQVAFNDDSGPGLDSVLTYTATSSGTFYINASAFSTQTGSYEIEVTQAAPPAPGTLDELANYLTNGYWTDTGRNQRSWDTSSSNVITVDITTLSAEGQQLARWAMQAWEMVADIQFQEVSSGAMMTFQDTDSGAYAGATSLTGTTINSALVNVGTGWLSTYGTTLDSYSFQTYVHEIGHALGLGHQGNYNGSASYGTDETFSNDSWQMSIMSYFSQTENTTTSASYGLLLGPMIADILAIQNLYGAPSSSSETGGNTTWGANTNMGGYWGDIWTAIENGDTSGLYSGNPIALTIYDESGRDTLNLSFTSGGDRVDMRSERFSDVSGGTENVGIARGTVLENLIAGSGNDTITGNNANNNIKGNGGNDSILGGGGKDTINGGAGADTIKGGNGNDKLKGGGGKDKLEGGSGKDTLEGGSGNDNLKGGSANDKLKGNGGKDVLDGGTGNDTLTGGGGADKFVFKGGNIGNDVVKDYNTGTDKLRIDDALWAGTLTKAQVINTYASVVNGDVVFDFGGGNTITLEGVNSLAGLASDLTII